MTYSITRAEEILVSSKRRIFFQDEKACLWIAGLARKYGTPQLCLVSWCSKQTAMSGPCPGTLLTHLCPRPVWFACKRHRFAPRVHPMLGLQWLWLLTWSGEKPTTQPAKMPSPTNTGHSQIRFYPWNKIPNSSQAKARPRKHRICFSSNGEGHPSNFPGTLLSSKNLLSSSLNP